MSEICDSSIYLLMDLYILYEYLIIEQGIVQMFVNSAQAAFF